MFYAAVVRKDHPISVGEVTDLQLVHTEEITVYLSYVGPAKIHCFS